MSNPVEGRRKVFVSYSHKDIVWLERLKVHLKPLEREGLVDLWDDTKIHAGARWREEISDALNSAAVAVLLVSADFIASDFIDKNELPPLLAAAEKDGVKILPLILSPSRFEKIESLSRFQSVNPTSEPLIKLDRGEQEELFVKLSDDVLRAVEETEKRSVGTERAQSQQISIPADSIEEQALNQRNLPTGLERQEIDLPAPGLSRWGINHIRSTLLSHKLLAISIGFIIVAAGVAAYIILLRRSEASATSVITLPKFQLASTEIKDTYKPTPNIAFLKYRLDFGNVDGLDNSGNRKLIWTGEGVSRNRNAVNQIFGELKISGVTAVVWFLFADGGASPDFDKDGYVTGLDQSFVNDYKTAIELAEKNDISIIWVLIDNQWMKPKEVQKDGAHLYGHADVIEDPKKRASFFEKALKPLLQLYPTQKYIAGWIIVNEPEVALEQGYVLEKDLNGFIREAANLIKEKASHQAVSIGHLDLESLLKYRQDHKDTEFDFYVFHHYKTYMPPSVGQIRRQMEGTNNKPIYIGEFSLNEPAKPRPILDTMRDLDLRRFVNWSRALGYAGVWPWALKPLVNEPPRIKDIAEISSMIEEFRRQPNELDNSERIAWLDHANRGIGIVTKEIEGWKSDLAVHSNEITKNSADRERSTQLLSDANTRLVSERHTLAEAHEKHATVVKDLEACQGRIAHMLNSQSYDPAALATERANERKLKVKLKEVDQWVKNASGNLKKTEVEISKQDDWLRTYKQRVRLNEYQSMMKKFRIQMAQTLYLDYWRDEIRKASSADASSKGAK